MASLWKKFLVVLFVGMFASTAFAAQPGNHAAAKQMNAATQNTAQAQKLKNQAKAKGRYAKCCNGRSCSKSCAQSMKRKQMNTRRRATRPARAAS